ncbi:MAG: 5-(carboxyamino)imidazole ribonucleotide synthase [Actinobacteria bacterium]|nr:5-(carboxyamino)imidazole ribonucleotide synthase [Actinomycetota bacterium]MBI3687877.1 5-(carboxyamino)imidazole ribonucleotide synthase [Actinomycetota bacterium]
MDSRTGLPVVGMVGAGQLARMTHQAAISVGQSLRIFAAAPDDGAALVAADVVIGDHTDLGDLGRFAAGCDVLTFDHEHVPTEVVTALAAAGHAVFPSAAALRYAQDKQAMRARLGELGIGVPRWAPVRTAQELLEFGERVGWPLVLKAVRGGYDGAGVWIVGSGQEAAELVGSGIPLIAEERVPLVRELSVLVARSPFGQGAAWPVVETVQQDGVCVQVLAPAPGLAAVTAERLQALGLRIAAELGVVGVLAVELFETADGVLVNELAMRPHNSGHWTIEGARTSQFEQHLRAVLDYPLGVTGMTAAAVVTANVLGGPAVGPGIDERLHHVMARWPEAKVHLYGKRVRPGRKLGHVTVLGDRLELVRERAVGAARYLAEGVRP